MSATAIIAGATAIINFATTYGPQIVALASIVNTMIPAGKPGTFQAGIKQIINAFSVGFGRATPSGLAK